MFNQTHSNRRKASEVCEDLKEMVESLGAKPHCENVSPIKCISDVDDETEDAELMVRENIVSREMTYETFRAIDEAVMAEREEQQNLSSKQIDWNYRGLEAGFTMGKIADWNQQEDEQAFQTT
jgi:hypothetical protein